MKSPKPRNVELLVGFTIGEIYDLSKIDRCLPLQIEEIIDSEEELVRRRINRIGKT